MDFERAARPIPILLALCAAFTACGFGVRLGNPSTSGGSYRYFAFATDFQGMVTPFQVDSSTGKLTAGTAVSGGTYPNGLALSPLGSPLVVADFTTASIHTFNFNLSTGTLTPGATLPAGASAQNAVFNSDGSAVIVSNSGGSSLESYRISGGILNSGQTTSSIASPGFVFYDPTRNFVYVTGIGVATAYAFNPLSGVGNQVGSTATMLGSNLAGAVFVPGFGLLAATSIAVHDLELLPVGPTGALSNAVSLTTFPFTTVSGLAATPNGKYVFASDPNTGTYTYSVGSSTASQIGFTTVSGGSNYRVLAVDPTGTFLYVSSGSTPAQLLSYVIGSNGSLTQTSSVSFSNSLNYMTVAAIPQ